jgi:peptidyl-prolyl cis-trans isomerase C
MNAMRVTAAAPLPHVDGVPLARPEEAITVQELRQRAGTELLRQAAMRAGLLAADDPQPLAGAISEAAAVAIEAWLERCVVPAVPDEASCRRWHAAHAARFAHGERVRLRHILFAVTSGVDVNRLRERAESCLVALRARSRVEIEAPDADDRFAAAAREFSNCPSAVQGGDLGWVAATDCAPEFSREVFTTSGGAAVAEIGVLPRLVPSRHGLHVVEVLERRPGEVPAYEAVQAAVAQALGRQAWATTLRHTIDDLAAEACIEGVELEAACGASEVDTALAARAA